MLKRILIFVTSFAIFASMNSQALSREDVEPLVLPHYPESLIAEWRNATGLSDLELLSRGFQYLIDDFNGDGAQTIFVSYQNMRSVSVAMLDMEGNLIGHHGSLPEMRGHSVAVDTLDFTGDGFGEIALRVQGGLNLNSKEKNFILAWDGGDFSLLTPMISAYGKTYPAIAGASYLDVDGDGVYEIYDESNSEAKTILKYVDGSFQSVSEVAAFIVFKAYQGRLEVVTEAFSLEDPSQNYRMFVFNGVDIDSPATSGSISINDVEVLSGGTFNSFNRLIDVPLLGLSFNNTVRIQGQGEPDAVVTILIERELVTDSDLELRIPATSDTMLRENRANRNEGTNPSLFVKGKGEKNNRAIVSFDLSDIDPSFASKAVLSLSIVGDATNWGKRRARSMSVHPLLEGFSEGNGMKQGLPKGEKFKGDGEGATWNCATDSNIRNKQSDCATEWAGGFFGPESSSVVHYNGMSGVVNFDVYQDILNGHSAWLVKKTNEEKGGRILYFSREGASLVGESTLSPSIILSYGDDGGGDDGGGDDCDPELDFCEPDCNDPELCNF